MDYIVGLAILIIILWFFKFVFSVFTTKVDHNDLIISPYTKQKQENLKKAREVIRARGRVTNADIEKLLGVSDATATRYLDELEEEGVIRQVGMGHHTYYEKI